MKSILNQEIKSNIRQVIKKEKGKTYCTGEIRLIEFAEDCLREIERLEKLVEGKESEEV